MESEGGCGGHRRELQILQVMYRAGSINLMGKEWVRF